MSQEWLEQNWTVVGLIVLVELVLKGIALWKAAKADSKPWFVTLLVINSIGILPLAYIFFLSKERAPRTTDVTK